MTSTDLTIEQTDILRLLSSKVHLGAEKINHAMKRYVDSKNNVGNYIFDLNETYKKIKLAARIIASVKNLAEVIVVCSKDQGQRAVYKFGQYTGATALSSSRWVPGTLTNQMTKKFQEPRLLIVTDPRFDHQAVIEASYVNIPTIALCNTDAPLEYIDVVIPCSNRHTNSISMVYWMLAREVKYLKGELPTREWDVMVDLFISRDIKKIIADQQRQKEEAQRQKEEAPEKFERTVEAGGAVTEDWTS